MNEHGFPLAQGLYDPRFEHDNCGVGVICHIKGNKSNLIVNQALEVLRRLSHRGAVGADPLTGDGAGILMQIPHKFFQKAAAVSGIKLPQEGFYGTGLVFLPADIEERLFFKELFYRLINSEGQVLLGWRSVPVNSSCIGKTARENQPVINQIFIGRGAGVETQLDFERKLYLIRKQVEAAAAGSFLKQKNFFYITNLSSRTFCYKGLLMPGQLGEFFLDLKDKDLEAAIAVVHSRYSTNTFPSWDLAQPFRFLAHNGEINTLRGNFNWMKAREGLLASDLFGDDIEKIKPVLSPSGSDSAVLDNMFELLVLGGRSIAQAMMMLIPAAWQANDLMPAKVKDFYKYHACVMEPWDGPAAVAFTDGSNVAAVLDRNGLRPGRYIITKNDMAVMASEAGVLDIEPEDILISGRLKPGTMFYVDTVAGRILGADEIAQRVSSKNTYGDWLKQNIVELHNVSLSGKRPRKETNIMQLMKVFGYTREDLKIILSPMAQDGKEPTGSMGNDTPLAVLSKKESLLYDYFKQLFAQVTNPAIDPIRESCVMSLETFLGRDYNILEESPMHCRKLAVANPVLSDIDLRKIKNIESEHFRSKTISLLFNIEEEVSFSAALDEICSQSLRAIEEGYSFLVFSDRGVNPRAVPLPALLAVGAVHQYLVRKHKRTRVSLILESGEPREVHHFALLFGYGADCINPYLAYSALEYLVKEKMIDADKDTAVKNYRKAVNQGILKILSKMGISDLQSYRGAQIFEAVGLREDVIEKCFTGTVSRISGAGFDVLAKESFLRHKRAFSDDRGNESFLPSGGVYQWKRDGEFHLWRQETIFTLQQAVRNGDYNKYKEFSQLINDQSNNPATLRGIFKFKTVPSIGLDEVEPAEKIFKRITTGAMSFGSISRGAHETLAIAMNRLGGKSNTGEGGEDPLRFKKMPGGDLKRSAIKQIASGRFGVSTNYLVNADEIQIKIAQGAKPGEGGQLPGHKVSVEIAKIRYTTPGVMLISPPPHHDIYSIEDLAQLIFDLKNVNPSARISVKLVSEIGVGTVAAGVAKGGAEMILISGGDGGTGASPVSSIRHAGLPWELGLSETHQVLVLNGLRSRVRLQVDGQMRTGRDAAIAILLGAQEFGFCTAVLIALGCVMLRHCHLNNCSAGVATQDEILQKRFCGKQEYVENYFRFVVKELREIMARLGARTIDELAGRADLLEVDTDIIPWKAEKIDYSKILYQPKVEKCAGSFSEKSKAFDLDNILDRKLISLAKGSLASRQAVKYALAINNTNRAAGAMLSGEVCRRFGEEGLPADTIWFKFQGIAGQSFGAWLASGITFELEGLANDYVGKGVSGGKIIVYPSKQATYKTEENIIIGNTCFYGAIKGEAYIRGEAGERFCVRNSGVNAVVEGVGDHGCEYMTGGRVVVLGRIGRNFAAGMSGGIAYVYKQEDLKDKCNMDMVDFDAIDEDDRKLIFELVSNHYRYTGSIRSKLIIDDFENLLNYFVKIMPKEYKRVLEGLPRKQGVLSEVSDG